MTGAGCVGRPNRRYAIRRNSEEAQKGDDAIKFRLAQPNAMYDGHDLWMSALKARSERITHS